MIIVEEIMSEMFQDIMGGLGITYFTWFLCWFYFKFSNRYKLGEEHGRTD